MKTKVKITIGDCIYEVESSYEHGIDSTRLLIEKIIAQHLLIVAAKN